jgi:hypothetical protein
MLLPCPTDKLLRDLLDKLAGLELPYPSELLDARRAQFVAMVEQKTAHAVTQAAGSKPISSVRKAY